VHTGFWWAQASDEMITLKRLFRMWDWGGMKWNDPTQNRNTWQALVNVVLNLQVP
jgi:hypothetical protein